VVVVTGGGAGRETSIPALQLVSEHITAFRPLIGRDCRAWPPSATLGLPYVTGSAEKCLPPSVAAGAANPCHPSALALPTMAPLSLMSVIQVTCPAVENCHHSDLGVHGNVVSSFGNCLTNF
jgi:hypothetical protein